MTPVWPIGTQHARCPVCALEAAHAIAVEVPAAPSPIRFLRCAACATVFTPGALPPSYESDGPLDETVQYYVEQLAAIDTVVDPLFTLDRTRVRRYAEIGCSFGFALDFGHREFGWEVRGVDPSALAAAGGLLLRLPIETRYFTEDEPLPPPPADLLVASEVVEHVADPHAFMRALAASLAPEGVLVLSTPNATAVHPDTPHGALVQVLCPGYHLVLLTAAGLRRLVEAHGFRHHHVRETPTGLTIFAGRHPFAWATEGRTDRVAYVRYLQGRLADAPPGSALECGMLYRLLREHAAFAQWTEAEALTPRIAAAYAQRGLNLLQPGACRPACASGASFTEFARRHPMNVGGVLFALGMVAMLHREDGPRAAALFDAAAAWLGAVRRVLAGFGTTDAESDEFELQAMEHATVLTARTDQAAAAARLEAMLNGDLAVDSGRAARWRVLLFIELVNAGDHARASALHAAAAAGSDADAVLDAKRLLALGIHALNGRADPAKARHWLSAVLAVTGAAPPNPVLADLGRAAAAALRVALPEAAPAPPRPTPPSPAPRWPAWLRRRLAPAGQDRE
ncbi:MAG: class I SAM-dependent methyltransferase [Janthinobacterium lividum]